MIPSPTTLKQTTRISCGKAPRKQLALKNTCSSLTHREFMHVLQQDLPGEWDHKLPKKEPKEPTPEWKPRSIVEKLWDDLDRTSRDFQQAYWLLMGVVKDLQDHYGREKSTKEDDK
jgi:hypothetical protein